MLPSGTEQLSIEGVLRWIDNAPRASSDMRLIITSVRRTASNGVRSSEPRRPECSVITANLIAASPLSELQFTRVSCPNASELCKRSPEGCSVYIRDKKIVLYYDI